jgi:hypothetical protein
VKPPHIAGRKLPGSIASSGCARAEQVEKRIDRQGTRDKESHGQHTQCETHEPHQHKPVPMQARFRLASWLEAFGSVSRCLLSVHRSAPVQGAGLYYNAKKSRTTGRSF